MKLIPIVCRIVLGCLAGSLIAAVMTYLDWRMNPADLFRSEEVTHWGIVAETFLSWALPFSILLSITVFAFHFIIPKILEQMRDRAARRLD